MPSAVSPSFRAEVVGGFTTFLTMSYIVVVNPSILATPGTGLPFDGVLAATVLLAASMTLLMGLYANLPFGVAPGMGLNVFLAYTVILQRQIPWPIAFGCVFWAGVLFLLLSITPVRELIAAAVPQSLRLAAAAGIGLLLTFIGLRSAGLVVADPATIVRAGTLDHRALLMLGGLAMAVVLQRRANPFAFVATIAAVTGASLLLGDVEVPERVTSTPALRSVLLRADPLGALQLGLAPTMIAIAMTDLFDSLSTFMGVAAASGLTDPDGRPLNLRRGLIVDAWATLGAALLGSSPGTAYVESISGISMGARTGRAAVVTALCFVPCLFLAPLAAMVPGWATAPVLIMVGVSMFAPVQRIDFSRLAEGVPAFATLILIPLTLSITQGLLWGFVLYALLHALTGRARELRPTVWAIAVMSGGLLVLDRLG